MTGKKKLMTKYQYHKIEGGFRSEYAFEAIELKQEFVPQI